jgi:Anti-sigma regulatory factor (Ser/Thr protein kinase)
MSVVTAASDRQYYLVLSEAHPELMRPVRELLRAHLRLWHKGALSSVAELGVTELLANVYKHASGICELLVRETPDGIVVEVTDFGNSLPTVKQPADDEEGGRGLFLLSALTDDLGFEPLLGGKRVWFRLQAP